MIKLKALRQNREMSLDQLSDILKVNKSTLSRIENGLREPKQSFIIDCAKYFDVSTDYLLGNTDDPRTTGQIVKDNQKALRLEVSSRVKSARLKKGFSLFELGEISKIPSSYIAELEAGAIEKPSVTALHSIADALGVRVFDLISDESQMITREQYPAELREASLDYIVVAKKLAKSGIPAETILEIAESLKKMTKQGEPGHSEK